MALAASSDICIAVVGDRSGLFGRGTSGEGCDAADLTLPGIQGQLLAAPFGHGLSYTTFCWEDIEGQSAQVPTNSTMRAGLTVRNVGERPGTEIVQLHLHDPVAQVTRPTVVLIGYARAPLEPGQQRRVEFTIHTDLTTFVGRGGQRIVEPGRIELRVGTSSASRPRE